MRVARVSQHALQRYRLVHADASADDLLRAATLALRVDAGLAQALAGRVRVTGPGDEVAEHRADLDGRGLFVIAPIGGEPGSGMVVTWLRLGLAQQAMLRRWYFEPLELLREVFHRGYAAGAAGAAPAVEAFEAQRAELELLVRRLAGAVGPEPEAAAEGPAEGEGPTEELTGPLGPRPDGRFVWSAHALHDLRRLREHAPLPPESVAGWRWLPRAAVAEVEAAAHVQRPAVPWGALVPPGAALVATVVEDADQLQIVRVFTVPWAVRARADAAAEPLVAHPALLVGRPAPPPAPAPPPPQGEPRFVPADALKPTHWSAAALRDAAALGVDVVPVSYFGLWDALPPEQVAAAARENGWCLSTREYGARVMGRCVALVSRDPKSGKDLISRVGRRPGADGG